MQNYVVCTVQRSGKSWIVSTLQALGLGDGMELLSKIQRNRMPQGVRFSEAWRTGGLARLGQEFRVYTAEEGHSCVGLTLQWNTFSVISELHRASEFRALVASLEPCLILFLVRRDILGQAISHYLMDEGGYAHSTQNEAERRMRSTVRYDRTAIDRFVTFTQTGYQHWRQLFEAAKLEVTTLFYEDFVAEPERSFQVLREMIAEDTGRGAAIGLPLTHYRKLSDEINERFRAEYLAGRRDSDFVITESAPSPSTPAPGPETLDRDDLRPPDGNDSLRTA